MHPNDGARSAHHDPATRARGLRIMRVAGIDIWIDPSWVISIAILSFYAWDLIARDLVRDSSRGVSVLVSIALGLALAGCILLHELAHSLVARAYRLRVRRITLFALGGVSEIETQAEGPGAEFNIALAGPLASILIAAVSAAIARVRVPHAEGLHGAWGAVGVLNLWLAVFNLVPAFPMDGGRILRSALWAGVRSRRRATHWAAVAGRTFAAMLIGGGVVAFLIGVFGGGEMGAAFIYPMVLGAFIYKAASASERLEGGDLPNEPVL